MVIPLHVALEATESYFNEDAKEHVILGSMVGTHLFHHIFDLCLGYFKFHEILLIEGCQDYMGMSEPSPVNNHFWYGSLIGKQPVGSLYNNFNDPFSMKILNHGNPILEFYTSMNFSIINKFKLVIVTDAHLIPEKYFSELRKKVSGKMIILVDPYTIHGGKFTNVPTVIDTTSRCDPLIALARAVYDVDTTFIDNSTRKMIDVTHQSISKTFTGKNLEAQVCSNDMPYVQFMQCKQQDMGWRKKHKLMVTGNTVKSFGSGNNLVTLTNTSLLSIENIPGTLHSTMSGILNRDKLLFHFHPIWEDKTNLDKTLIPVKPANVLSIEDIGYHKFNKLIYVQGDYQLSRTEKYTLLQATEHLAIAEE